MAFLITGISGIIHLCRHPVSAMITSVCRCNVPNSGEALSMAERNRSLTLSTSTPPAQDQFDYRKADDFYQKSLSEHTRRAYRRVIYEFFTAHRNLHPGEITPKQILAWRDSLVKNKQKPNTVTFKLSVVRSFYEYLRAAGIVTFNPADTKLAPPPALPEEMIGRALTSQEARLLLTGPDRRSTAGARDHALLLTLLRLSLRVSEVCSLRAGCVKWSHGRWIVKFKVKGGRERTLPLPGEGRA